MYKVKNKLKDLIYIQENKPCNEQTINGLFRSIVEPVLEENIESVVFCRLEDKSKKSFKGILNRLEYSKAKVYDFSDTPISGRFENVLKEKIWENTEFIYILSQRYGAILDFDYTIPEIDGYAGIYILHNSKSLSDSFEIINANSKVDLSGYQEQWHPDRRDNEALNSSIRKIVDLLNETNQEVMIFEKEKEITGDDSKTNECFDQSIRLEFISKKLSHVSHEIRNQLSICDLYSSIVQKHLSKIDFEDDAVKNSLENAIDCIQKSLKIAGSSLFDLKSLGSNKLETIDFSDVVKTAVALGRVYISGKEIKITNATPEDLKLKILADENKLLAVLINLIKNAIESIEENGQIEITTEVGDESIKLTLANDGKPMSEEIQEKVFEEGFTTKSSGSGLGLYICKKALEEQFAQLELKKSDEISTEFEITFPKIL